MTLKLYNTRERKKQDFTPLNKDRITMYVCGPTVYNFIHIGNARPTVVFDTLFRILQQEYSEVVYARNITDIDDKIMKVAAEGGETIGDVSTRYAEEYSKDMASLLNLEPTIVPYATNHIAEMIAMIESLVQGEHAYVAEGHVLFNVRSMADYGKLSNRSLDDMLAGARVEVASYKENAGDFVLWKPSTDAEPGWDSPWGRGRPGWHIECSAMIEKHLGDTIDIHGGGRDLIFPHHENELAQSQCAHGGKAYVQYWMHNGYINIDGEKMSKSLGNFKTVRGLLETYRGEVLRYALLTAQYRSDMDFSVDLLEQSKASLDSLYGALRNTQDVKPGAIDLQGSTGYGALLDDINTPLALSELHGLAKALNKGDAKDPAAVKGELLAVAGVMGLLELEPNEWFQGEGAGNKISAEAIDALIAERIQAKKDKQYARADEIRAELKSLGVVLEDGAGGTSWRFE